ncbi:tyrosine kinase abl, putative [Babesia ovis]|uniref:Tyrosine kinase abl, putative n=1 Tax=Babesia ovis TaxID=5869 RepID=A0A9W5WVB3_BABOV|nr:tyrosine kinase abl, putative [Babesia ovis]
MAAVLEHGLPKLGIDADCDLISYLVDLLYTEGVDACAEWIESASTAPDSHKCHSLAEEAFASLKATTTEGTTAFDLKVDNALDGVDIALAAAKAAAINTNTTSGNANAWNRNQELDKDVKREIVERYACVELQTIHLGDDGQVYSSGVSLRDLEEDVVIPVNDNAARVKKEQQQRRMLQKQQHMEAQAKQQQQKLKQQQREEKERLRCQKKERQK